MSLRNGYQKKNLNLKQKTKTETVTLYAEGLPILEAKIDKDLEEMNKEVSERIQNLCKIAKENLERKNGKHFKDN